MKTVTLDVGGMLSMLDYQAVEKQLGRIPGVRRAAASIASNSATVEYDETVTSVAAPLPPEAGERRTQRRSGDGIGRG